jgi:hypothetical protein
MALEIGYRARRSGGPRGHVTLCFFRMIAPEASNTYIHRGRRGSRYLLNRNESDCKRKRSDRCLTRERCNRVAECARISFALPPPPDVNRSIWYWRRARNIRADRTGRESHPRKGGRRNAEDPECPCAKTESRGERRGGVSCCQGCDQPMTNRTGARSLFRESWASALTVDYSAIKRAPTLRADAVVQKIGVAVQSHKRLTIPTITELRIGDWLSPPLRRSTGEIESGGLLVSQRRTRAVSDQELPALGRDPRRLAQSNRPLRFTRDHHHRLEALTTRERKRQFADCSRDRNLFHPCSLKKPNSVFDFRAAVRAPAENPGP